MKKRSNLISVALFLMLVLFPAATYVITSQTHLKMSVTLHGYSDKVAFPKFSKKEVLNSNFQKGFEDFFYAKMAGRSYFIKTYCVLQFRLFNLINRIVGVDSYITDSLYTASNCGLTEDQDFSRPENYQKLVDYVEHLKNLQTKLLECNKKFLYYITPDKSFIFPDKIPKKYLMKKRKDFVPPYYYLKKLLTEKNIIFLDTCEFITRDLDFPVFYKGGIHLARPADTLISKKVIEKLNDTYGSTLPEISLGKLNASPAPYWRDSDVLSGSNCGAKLDNEFYEYDILIEETEDSSTPRVLLQGGSFADSLFYDYFKNYSQNFFNIFYNYSMRIGCIDATSYISIKNFSDIDMGEYLDKVDYVIIEINTGAIPLFSSGFVEYMDAYLDDYMARK